MRATLVVAVVFLSMLPPFGNAAQRTFVSSVGSDANACAIAAPCRSFATALTHTDPNGEIIVLDSAGYGSVVIDRSVSITAPAGVYAGVSVFSGDDGIKIAGGGIDVALRGLTINGQGGNRGIFYTLGASLRISNCVVSNMTGAGVSLGFGGEIAIEDSLIRDNGDHGVDITLNPNVIVARTVIDRNNGQGINFTPTATAATLTVIASQIVRNSATGVTVISSTDDANVSVVDSTIARNTSGAIALLGGGGSTITALLTGNAIVRNGSGVSAISTGAITGSLTDNLISHNGVVGIRAANAGALLVLDRNTVTHNGQGVVQVTGGVIETRSNNTVRENTMNTVGAPFTAAGGV
jgi:hypothetical protein